MAGDFEANTILFNKYRLENIIGRGGFGSIYKAIDIRLGRAVAIKTLLHDQNSLDKRYGSGTFDKYLDRFKREATVSSYFTENPHIITVYGLEEDEKSNFFLILEYLGGGSLVELIRQEGKLSIPRTCAITLDICAALADIHEHPADIVHRDLKPGNVLLRNNGKAVVADFGVAQVGHDSHRTVTGLTGNRHPGSLPYMSPEQASRFEYLTPTSDLYSLGLLIYEMLTGRIYAKIRILPVSKLNDEVPDWLDRLVIKLLQKEPEDRFQQAAEVGEAIRAGLAQLEVATYTETTPMVNPAQREGSAASEFQPELEKEVEEWKRRQAKAARVAAATPEEAAKEAAQRQAEAALKIQLEREAKEELAQAALIKTTPLPNADKGPANPEQAIEDLSAQLVIAGYLADWDEVIALGERILKLDEKHQPTLAKTAAAYKSRGVAGYVKGDYDRAITDFGRAIKLEPHKADYYAQLGSAYHNRGYYERAITSFSHAIKLDPDKSDYYLQRGNACHHKGDYDRAISNFNQALKLHPNQDDCYWQRGNSYFSKGDYKRAIDDYSRAIKLDPGIAQYYYSRGLAHRARDDRKAALRDLQQAEQLGFIKATAELINL